MTFFDCKYTYICRGKIVWKQFIVILIVAFSANFGSYGQLSSIFVQKSTKSEKSVKTEQPTECAEIGCFEGEIIYETFENYSDWIRKMANSVYVDGVHKMRLLVKGNKMHLIDETTRQDSSTKRNQGLRTFQSRIQL